MHGRNRKALEAARRCRTYGRLTASTRMASSLLLAGIFFTPPPVAADDNEDLELGIAALIGAHNLALPVSFFPDPFISIPASAVTFGTNLGLKDVRAVFVTPADWADQPNSDDRCTFDFDLPQSAAGYNNLLGLFNLEQVPAHWGELTRSGPSVQVVHANTDVDVSVVNQHITPGQSPQQVRFPAGRHTVKWRAETQISDAFDIIIPAALLGFNLGYYGTSWANQGKTATRQLFLKNKNKARMVTLAVKAGVIADGALDILGTRTTVTHEREQEVTIYKVVPPEISTSQPLISLEASDFGGVSYARVADQLRASIDASDPCGLPFSLSNDATPLLNLGENRITWTVSDSGPLPGGGGNSDSLIQRVTVEDTQGPILVPPPGRVIEAQSGLGADQVLLGVPRVVDLADPAPAIENNGPAFYPINSRSAITWKATDRSGNASQADQLITIKAQGTNTAPQVSDVSAETLTSEPVDIVLSGQDSDFLDDRFDPLSFRISRRPANGEFVAPLLPFFIEDYRTNPAGPHGQEFLEASNKRTWLYENVCQVLGGPDNDKIPLDWVHRPLFVHVSDEGLYVMIDFFFRCGPSNVGQNKRLKKGLRLQARKNSCGFPKRLIPAGSIRQRDHAFGQQVLIADEVGIDDSVDTDPIADVDLLESFIIERIVGQRAGVHAQLRRTGIDGKGVGHRVDRLDGTDIGQITGHDVDADHPCAVFFLVGRAGVKEGIQPFDVNASGLNGCVGEQVLVYLAVDGDSVAIHQRPGIAESIPVVHFHRDHAVAVIQPEAIGRGRGNGTRQADPRFIRLLSRILRLYRKGQTTGHQRNRQRLLGKKIACICIVWIFHGSTSGSE